jgi:5-methyltetrahydrofolate--homocysteine methyltransferase
MRTTLTALLADHRALLADGATGTNYFQMGLTSGEPPELWNVEHPDRVMELHRAFVDGGADIILTNSFGGTAQRLKLHHAQDRVRELNRRAAELARAVADAADRPVAVAGSVGPTGELFEPLGALTEEVAVASFTEQIEGLRDGGADVIWIETMSAPEEVRAAATAAALAGMPYVATCSFDTAGRTMMGLLPSAFPSVFEGLPQPPVAIGANCGVGASDILVSVLEMTGTACEHPIVSKGNCGVPRFVGTEAVYSGTPELMADYVRLAVSAGARIVGGCCGTSPEHLAAMRRALDEQCAETAPERPTHEVIVDRIGPLANAAPTAGAPGEGRERRRRRG